MIRFTEGFWKCECDIGFTQVDKACIDIDECTVDNITCTQNEVCRNTGE